MNCEIKEMTAGDIDAIAGLEKECFSVPWTREGIAEELNNPCSRFLCAHCGGVAGYIGVQEICGEAYITNIAVSVKHRREGIGRALLKSACEGAQSRGCEFITLEVRKSNAPAIALYASEGFELEGERKNFYSSPVENGLIYTRYFKR